MKRLIGSFFATLVIASTATPGAAQEIVFSGDEILFTGWRDRAAVYALNPDTGEQRRLTSPNSAVPVWSPGRDRIAFVRYLALSDWIPDTRSSLMVMDRSGIVSKLTDGKSNDFDAAWSPDGTRLVFSRYTTEDNLYSVHLFLINADGSELRELTTGSGVTDAEAKWAPDGSKIAFSRNHGGSYQTIMLVDPDSGESTEVTSDQTVSDSQPEWSPDGRRIAFTRFSYRPQQSDIYLVDATGGTPTALTQSSTRFEEQTEWSPDGSEIAFVKGRFIVVKPADGGQGTQLTFSRKWAYGPTWSPDGDEIAFLRGYDRNQDIYVVRRDGGGGRRLTKTRLQESTLDW